MLSIGGSASGQANMANTLSSAAMCRPPTDLPLDHSYVKVHGALTKEANSEIPMNLHFNICAAGTARNGCKETINDSLSTK